VLQSVIEAFGNEAISLANICLTPPFSTFWAMSGARIHIPDAGCGTSYLCCLLSQHGAIMTGLEPAAPFILLNDALIWCLLGVKSNKFYSDL
jgi:hypothetical protein